MSKTNKYLVIGVLLGVIACYAMKRYSGVTK